MCLAQTVCMPLNLQLYVKKRSKSYDELRRLNQQIQSKSRYNKMIPTLYQALANVLTDPFKTTTFLRHHKTIKLYYTMCIR